MDEARRSGRAVSGMRFVLARSNTGIVGCNATRGTDVCLRLFHVCVFLCSQQPCDRAEPPPTLYKIQISN
jgi:hypothetical protein